MNNLQAGIADHNLEVFRVANKLLATHGGKTYEFSKLPQVELQRIQNDLNNNPRALAALESWGFTDPSTKLEKYASCRFGGIDLFPDVQPTGELTPDYHHCSTRHQCPHNGVICACPAGPNGELSPRELEILVLIAQNKMEKEIADNLDICQSTVAKTRKSLFFKTGTNSSLSLTLFAHKHNLIPHDHAV